MVGCWLFGVLVVLCFDGSGGNVKSKCEISVFLKKYFPNYLNFLFSSKKYEFC